MRPQQASWGTFERLGSQKGTSLLKNVASSAGGCAGRRVEAPSHPLHASTGRECARSEIGREVVRPLESPVEGFSTGWNVSRTRLSVSKLALSEAISVRPTSTPKLQGKYSGNRLPNLSLCPRLAWPYTGAAARAAKCPEPPVLCRRFRAQLYWPNRCHADRRL
jgi:hypothetical protein